MGRTKIIVRRAIDCGRGRVRFLLGLAALIFIPLGLLDALQTAAGVINTDAASDFELLAQIASAALHFASSLLGVILFGGAVAIAVVGTPPGVDPSLPMIIRRTRWGTLVAIDLLFVAGLFFSALLLVIPLFFFFARYVLAAVLAEIEELGVGDSFRRSAELSRGSRRLVLGILFAAAAIGDIAAQIIQEGAQTLGLDGFVADWISSSGTDILYNPIVALLTVTIALELGGRPVQPQPETHVSS